LELSWLENFPNLSILDDSGMFPTWTGATGPGGAHTVPVLDLGPVRTSEELPASVAERCGDEIKQTRAGHEGRLEYHEVSAPSAAPAEVLGDRKNNELRGGQPRTVLSTQGVHAVAEAEASEGMLFLRVAIGLAAFWLIVLAGNALWNRRG